jgi:hypothetical protein
MNKRSYKKNNKKIKKSLSKVKTVGKKSKRSKVTRRRRNIKRGGVSPSSRPSSGEWELMSSPSSPSGSPVFVEESGVPAHLRKPSFTSETCPTCQYRYISEPGFVHVCTPPLARQPTIAASLVKGARDVARPARNLLGRTGESARNLLGPTGEQILHRMTQRRDVPEGREMVQVSRGPGKVTWMEPHGRPVGMFQTPWDEKVTKIAPGVYDPEAFEQRDLADTTELMKKLAIIKKDYKDKRQGWMGGSRKNRKNKRSTRRK